MASPTQRQAVCPVHGQVLAVKNSPSHLFHLVMTILTFGLWIIVWFFVSQGGYRCPYCGQGVRA